MNIPFFHTLRFGHCSGSRVHGQDFRQFTLIIWTRCLSTVSLGTGVNTPFFQEPIPKFRHGAGSRVQGRNLRQRSHLEPSYDASTKLQGQEFLWSSKVGTRSLCAHFVFCEFRDNPLFCSPCYAHVSMASVTAEWSSYVSGAKGVNTIQFYSKEQALVLGHQEQRLRIPSGVFGQNYQ